MSIRTKALRRVAAAAGALTLAGLGLAGGASIAHAAPGDVDFTEDGSITVHKLTQPATPGAEGTGEQITIPSGSEPIAGVDFTVTQITSIDLSDPAEWDQLATLTVADAKATETLGTPATGTTDVTGAAAFTPLPVGVYIVEETSVANANVNGEPVTITSQAAPWIVVIPTSINDVWTYDIHTYPKNVVTQLVMAVNETLASGLGSAVSWPVTATPPVYPGDELLSAYTLTDVLDPRLAYTGISGVTYNGVALVEGTDYSVTVTGQEVVITLLAPGLSTVNATPGAELALVVETTITTIDDGMIPNSITQSALGSAAGAVAAVTLSNEPLTNWGAIQIIKQDQDSLARISGAEFQVYSVDPATNPGATPIEFPTGTAGLVDGSTNTFVTNDDNPADLGSVVIPGLVTGQDNTQDYWLVETKAPAGYVLDAAPRLVTVVTSSIETAVDVVIDNVKQDRPLLPQTGGAGTVAFSVGGLGLVLVAVVLGMRSRRSRATA
ncbi:SpaH/EbpB family LPXTG-anchored major pilin [Tessaracoccus sp. OS52]|uniref:SpaH/EbpB family LPXTG-anchored major pilin n=1 Tax=Tessaracoccus sp. OS52 TaxID=2886691 RepID=UPI001D0FF2E0|nr:SpaH/EbpB family LPXTG-anchored major pilin [Tessaracoccus sp. OS52]